MQNSLFNAISNISQSFYDSYVEANAKFRARSGIKTIIIRRELGKCCDWCSRLAGIYDYSDAPDDVFARHDNCKCMVTVKSEKTGYVDAWSKKEYDTQREARIARNDEIQNRRNELDEINKIKRIARSEGKAFVDTTEYRLKHKLPGCEVTEAKYYRYNGKNYWVDGIRIIGEHNLEEKHAASVFANKLGGTIQMLPRVLYPTNVNSADMSVNGIKFEIKTPEGPKTGQLGTNIISSNIKRAKYQSNKVVLNITEKFLNKGTTINQVIEDVKRTFYSNQASWLDTVVIIHDDEIINVFEKP